MKSVSLEQLDQHVAQSLKQTMREDAVVLTENARPLGVLVRLPQAFGDAGADVRMTVDEANATVLISVANHEPQLATAKPIFGAGRGMLKILSEDKEHLNDFAEYMR